MLLCHCHGARSQYVTAECVSVDRPADQGAGERLQQEVALLERIIGPREVFHEISICMKL